MMYRKRALIVTTVAALAIGGGSAAIAAGDVDVFRQTETQLEDDQRLQSEATITVEQAIETARAERPGQVGDVELDREGGRLLYEIEIDDISVYVDAMTGDVVPPTELIEIDARDESDDSDDPDDPDDRDDDVPRTDGQLPEGVTITPDEAVSIAEQEADGPVGDIELEREGDRFIYEVEVGETDVEVDASTGDVLATDIDD